MHRQQQHASTVPSSIAFVIKDDQVSKIIECIIGRRHTTSGNGSLRPPTTDLAGGECGLACTRRDGRCLMSNQVFSIASMREYAGGEACMVYMGAMEAHGPQAPRV